MERTCVIIPTYNNEKTLADVIRSVRSVCEDVMVINDGSSDSTSQIIKEFGDSIIAIEYSPNRGKGHALKTAFREAVRRGYAYAVTMDSDGQHLAEDLAVFEQEIQQHPDSLLIGSRGMDHPNMPQQNTFANKFSNFWFTVQTAHCLPDTQSGYRLYPLRKMGRMRLLTNRYETELEVLVRSAWRGIRLIPVPIHVYYPPKEERVSHFRPRADFFRISVLNTIFCILAIVYGYPSMLFHKIFH
jgi:glycosyltransferase involved in cell wall biosynthesis